jgi:hypothetical protein
MLSAGIDTALAAVMAVRSQGVTVRVAAGSGGDRNFLDEAREYLAALGVQAAFLCLIVAHLECPDML